MFEAEIERTKLQLAEELLPSAIGTFLHLSRVLDHPTLDAAYKQFFLAEVEWLLYQDRMQRRSSLPIDESDAEFQRVYNQLESYIRQRARFERKQAMSLLDTAVKSILNFRLRPRVALKWFVYRGEPTKPICEIILRMRYFADYPYLLRGFEQWMHERNLSAESIHIMPVFEFERLIKQLDDEYILDLSTTEFIELLDPIFRFFNDATIPPALQSVPIEAVIVFLDDKDIQVIAQKLERMLYHDGVRTVTREIILRTVEFVLEELEQQESTRADISAPEIDPSESESTGHSLETADLELASDVPLPGDRTPDESEQLHTSLMPKEQSESQEISPLTPTPIEEHDSAEAAEEEPSTTTLQAPQEAVLSFEQEHKGEKQGFQLPQSEESSSRTTQVESQEHLPEMQSPTPDELSEQHIGGEISGEGIELLGKMLSETARETTDAFISVPEELKKPLELEFQIESTPVVEERKEPSEEISPPVEQRQSTEEEQTPVDESKPEQQTSQGRTQVVEPSVHELFERGLSHVQVTTPSPTADIEPLAAFLDNAQTETILKKLCGHDPIRFKDLMERLDAAPSLKAALNELDRYYADSGIDPSMKIAQELRLALFKRYALARRPA